MGDLRDKVKLVECHDCEVLFRTFGDLSYATPKNGGDHWIYRGEASEAWFLKPTIERFADSMEGDNRKYSIRQLENQLLSDFRTSASQFLANLPKDNDYLEWLAVLQHHGTPTRLLDWTYSPTVATHFAMKTKLAKAERACVWALNLRKLRDKLDQHKWDLDHVEKEIDPPLVVPFLPRNRYSRMSAQQGLFLVSTLTSKPFMQTLEIMGMDLSDGAFLKRLLIPHKERIRILAHLLEHNTHEVGMFADADGLGRFVRLKVEVQVQTLGLR